MPINELRSISTFIKAAELGSLRKAAAAQGMSPQAASQALAQLEAHLDVRLFHRTTRVMSLTDEGQRFLEAAQPALLGLQKALHSARRARDDISGPLRIVAPRTTFPPILWTLLDEFCALHPGIEPDVQLDDRLVNWVEDRVDVGFRAGLSPNDGVIARRLFALQLVICASPEYLRRHGSPDSLAALSSHRCSAFRHSASGQIVPWHVKAGDDVIEHHVVPALCTNDELLELQAVLSGKVIGQLAAATAAAYIRSGQLVPVLTDHVSENIGVFIYYGSRASQPARTRAFIDLAVQRLAGSTEYVLEAKELAAAARRGRRAARKS